MKVLQKVLARVFSLLRKARLYFLIKNKSVTFGSGCSIAAGVRVRATDGGRATFGAEVSIDRFADVSVKYGELIIGSGTYIGQFSVIFAREKIVIGNNCLIAEHVTIRDQDHTFGPDLITKHAGFSSSTIYIGDNVWIGAKVTITRGVKIGSNSIIGANSVVTHDVARDTIVGGVPSRILRDMR